MIKWLIKWLGLGENFGTATVKLVPHISARVYRAKEDKWYDLGELK